MHCPQSTGGEDRREVARLQRSMVSLGLAGALRWCSGPYQRVRLWPSRVVGYDNS
jgi:hypothetical protein